MTSAVMKRRRALFFDVDGTLMGYGGYVPESAKAAIRQVREQGDLVFINSGRIFQLARYIERHIETDGLLCGCGTDLYLGEQNLYRYIVPADVLRGIEEGCRRVKADLVLEGMEGVAVAPWARIRETLKVIDFIKAQDALWPGDFYDEDYKVNKFCVQYDEETDTEALRVIAGRHFDVIDRGHGFYECVPLGHGKAFAVRKIMELCDIDLEEVYVFGDSTNDLDMLKLAKHAIVMGKHDRELEPYAEYITTDLEDDGIANAMRHYGLI